jgi:Cft2 family RNA processing exonuclease
MRAVCTRVLTEILLRDSVRIMEAEQLRPDGETPLYSLDQVEHFLGRITTVNFAQPFAPIASFPALTVRYIPAGHILGAAMLYLETPEGRILHTGDISVVDQRTIKGLDLAALPQADLMICEGTYGNRSHSSRREEERKLAETVQTVLARGGRVVLPAFAIGRAQEIVLILKAFRASGQVSPVPIYLDGMVRSVCDAYQNQSHDLHPSLQRYLSNARRPLFADPSLDIFAVRSADRAALVPKSTPMVVIASSGMLTGGASPLYAAESARREADCLLFTGYQDEESPGAVFLNATQGDRLQLGEQFVTLNCQVARYNLSGHADAEQIVHVVSRVNPRHLILVHGAPESLEALARRFPKITGDIPEVGTTLVWSLPVGSASLGSPEAEVAQAEAEVPPPTIQALWKVSAKFGPTRPWTAVELGQHYYGAAYRPALRGPLEEVLREAAAYFKTGRVGAQPTYLPREALETAKLGPLAELTAGEIVLVQGRESQNPPQIALLLSAPSAGTVSLVGEQWKVGRRPQNMIQLVPGIRRQDWLEVAAEEAKKRLAGWHKLIEQQGVDLFVCWKRGEGQPATFADLCEDLSAEEEKLALGLELLQHGRELFRREGALWVPYPSERVSGNEGFRRHLELLEAGAGTRVRVHGRAGVLTGKSTWRFFEVRWLDGREAGETTQVYTWN